MCFLPQESSKNDENRSGCMVGNGHRLRLGRRRFAPLPTELEHNSGIVHYSRVTVVHGRVTVVHSCSENNSRWVVGYGHRLRLGRRHFAPLPTELDHNSGIVHYSRVTADHGRSIVKVCGFFRKNIFIKSNLSQPSLQGLPVKNLGATRHKPRGYMSKTQGLHVKNLGATCHKPRGQTTCHKPRGYLVLCGWTTCM